MKQEHRAILKTLGYCIRLFFIILFVVFLYKHYGTIQPCYVTYPNGTIEQPGLYGNCDYMNQYIEKQQITAINNKMRMMQLWNNKTIS